jgi:hypothetical protein
MDLGKGEETEECDTNVTSDSGSDWSEDEGWGRAGEEAALTESSREWSLVESEGEEGSWFSASHDDDLGRLLPGGNTVGDQPEVRQVSLMGV